mmetsp:Transcript_11495/g.28309  ORF Transcript_11495/g.28309 Transcript_11495/m.28309 type:complete len:113 (+) Transcript_11495:2202-2540(+)
MACITLQRRKSKWKLSPSSIKIVLVPNFNGCMRFQLALMAQTMMILDHRLAAVLTRPIEDSTMQAYLTEIEAILHRKIRHQNLVRNIEEGKDLQLWQPGPRDLTLKARLPLA